MDNPTFFYTVDTPHRWSSGLTVRLGDPDKHYEPIASLERAKELAIAARRGKWGQEDYTRTTYGVMYPVED